MYLIKIQTTGKKEHLYFAGWQTEFNSRTPNIANAKSYIFVHEALAQIQELKKQYPSKEFSLEETF